jgi:MFS family permease
MVMAWCGLLLIFDGYDLFIYGVVLPVIMKEWGLTPLQAGALGSYALFGMMFGALAFGSLADRIGRKKGIAICFALFSGATILNGFASSPSEFGIYRFIRRPGLWRPDAQRRGADERIRAQAPAQHAGGDHVQRLFAGRHAVGRVASSCCRVSVGSRCSSPPRCRCCCR